MLIARHKLKDSGPKRDLELVLSWLRRALPSMLVGARERHSRARMPNWIMRELHNVGTTLVPRSLLHRVRNDVARSRDALGGLGGSGGRPSDGHHALWLSAYLYSTVGADPAFAGPGHLMAALGVGDRRLRAAMRYAGIVREQKRERSLTSVGPRRCWRLPVPQSIDDLIMGFVLVPTLILRTLPRQLLMKAYGLTDLWALAELHQHAEMALATQILVEDGTDRRSRLVARQVTMPPSDIDAVLGHCGRDRRAGIISRLVMAGLIKRNDFGNYVVFGRP